MTQETKAALIRLAKDEAGRAADNLYRAKAAARGRDASLEWGQSGQSLQSIIDEYQQHHDKALAVVTELGGSMEHEPMFTKESA